MVTLRGKSTTWLRLLGLFRHHFALGQRRLAHGSRRLIHRGLHTANGASTRGSPPLHVRCVAIHGRLLLLGLYHGANLLKLICGLTLLICLWREEGGLLGRYIGAIVGRGSRTILLLVSGWRFSRADDLGGSRLLSACPLPLAYWHSLLDYFDFIVVIIFRRCIRCSVPLLGHDGILHLTQLLLSIGGTV